MSEPSITDLLLRAGFVHRKHDDQRHEVRRVSNGELVGYMDAHEAVEFLRTLPKGDLQ